MDESYTLTLSSPTAVLKAPAVWGAIRGLETFSQLLQMNGEYTIQGGAGMVIKDAPRFPWRGIMLDPARHFLTVAEVNSTIDAMAQNKLNALHLHLTDGESFTVNTESWKEFPLLSAKGAYAPQLSYTAADLTAIVAHGRLRGVRVIPEFDLVGLVVHLVCQIHDHFSCFAVAARAYGFVGSRLRGAHHRLPFGEPVPTVAQILQPSGRDE